ncbi:MAG TPA: hypothetical protein PKM59_13375, partial [Thermodesulfobacteriota bacterium]|nr:hypothetical protein [Thermodesulfobacteriota bacterium]
AQLCAVSPKKTMRVNKSSFFIFDRYSIFLPSLRNPPRSYSYKAPRSSGQPGYDQMSRILPEYDFFVKYPAAYARHAHV